MHCLQQAMYVKGYLQVLFTANKQNTNVNKWSFESAESFLKQSDQVIFQ